MAVTPRFRMVAGPNGSGKTTLWRWLEHTYAVNFYTFINADDMFAEATARRILRAPLPGWFRSFVLETTRDGGGR